LPVLLENRHGAVRRCRRDTVATLRDVARRAGVSIKTASNAINGYNAVSDRVRRRVQAAADELDYRPNEIARTLRGGGSGDLLTLLIPDAGDERVMEVARGVIGAAERLGCPIITDHRDADHEVCLLLLGPGAIGLLSAPSSEGRDLAVRPA
jgi:DNA-binding LacI/PurR family transcriptional regulator